jgi:hypothetical protein
MREICQSGSEGGARFNPSSLPLYEISDFVAIIPIARSAQQNGTRSSVLRLGTTTPGHTNSPAIFSFPSRMMLHRIAGRYA